VETLEAIVGAGDLRASLEAIRDKLAHELDEGVACKRCGGAISSPTPALAKALRETLTALDAIRAPEDSKSDDLKAKAARRRARVAKRAGGRGK
jgi:hypothetical protein